MVSASDAPTAQALALIAVLQQADSRGLNSEDYDGALWAARLAALGDPAAVARTDVALTVSAMRYCSDVQVGRLDPKHLKFRLTRKDVSEDLVQFVRADLVNGADVPGAMAQIEPRFEGYRMTVAALQRYLALARRDDGAALPVPAKTVAPGGSYAGAAALARPGRRCC